MNIPSQLGNYKLDQMIGRGASSEVWLARHVLLPDHRVAVKILMSQEREAIRRFQREATIAARLRHPNIIQLFDYGFSQPFFYTVLEHVEGGSLRQMIEKQQRLQLEAALAIFKQIAAALDYAHGLNVVHRDVSPGNILVEQGTGRALLTDFGIARDNSQQITIANPIMGTPGFLSPEHAQGARAVTHLSDLFSLGVVFYQMLSGELPWDEAPGMPDSPGFEAPLPLRQRGVENMPADVDRVIRSMLAIDPTRRFPSARAAVDELERIFARHHAPTQIVVTGAPKSSSPNGPIEYLSSGVAQNAVESVLGPDLIRAPIDRAHRRAEELRNPEFIASLLDAWAARGRFNLRRRLLGRLARLHKVSSRNVYFYRLRLLYEQRSAAEDAEEPDRKAQVFPVVPELSRWDVELTPVADFVEQSSQRMTLPGSARVVECKSCAGRGATVCPTCKGKQRIYAERPVVIAAAGAGAGSGVAAPLSSGNTAAGQSAGANTANRQASGADSPPVSAPQRTEQVLVPCPECSGRGGKTCERCEGVGRLIQRKVFRWQRQVTMIEGQADLPGVDEDWLKKTCKPEVLYTERQPGGLRPEWSLIPDLADIVRKAQEQTNADMRIVLSELNVSFIPVTDIFFDLGKSGDSGLYKLTIYGFENLIPADWRFLDWDRVVGILVVTFFFILTVAMAVVLLVL